MTKIYNHVGEWDGWSRRLKPHEIMERGGEGEA